MASSGSEGRFSVVFSGRPDDDGPAYSISIVPSQQEWNDFGHQSHVTITIRGKKGSAKAVVAGFVGFLSGAASGADTLKDLLARTPRLVVPADPDKHRFFTMLRDSQAYRTVVQTFGPEDGSEALRAVRDLVAIGEFDPTAQILELAAATEVFAISFVRDAESFFAFKNAGSILRGLEAETLGRLSEELFVRFQLPGHENEHQLEFSFDHSGVLPKRMAVVIGKNGVGKSQTLGRLARAALKGGPELTEKNGGRPTVSRLLAFAPTNEAESVFPSDRLKHARIQYQRFSLNRSRRSRRNEYAGDLVIQLARSDESIKGFDRWMIFLDSLKALAKPEEICLPTRSGEQPFEPVSGFRNGNESTVLRRFASIDPRKEPVRLIGAKGLPLSSGEISFIKFAAQVSLHIENGSLILLDEPETHLHPNFISRFVKLLDGLLERTGSAAIIATHSAYFVREVFAEQVTVLRVDESRFVTAEKPRLRTFGADVGEISVFVFGEEDQSDHAADLRERLLSQNMQWQEIYERYRNELSSEFLNVLRATNEERGGS
ncbi:AAA family ATPase [Variovorax sp. AFSI2.2]|uniref:AAA family ATPase n=1 Tax=Variovorax sp. AFSI2.2 TaxID=3384160 RepID=UPI003EBDFC55